METAVSEVAQSKRVPGKPFQPGNPGRPKGVRPRLTRRVITDILSAYDDLGGQKWLVMLGQKKPEVFARLLERLLPHKIEATITVTQIVAQLRAMDTVTAPRLNPCEPGLS